MPDGDGFELARQILQDPGLTAGVVLMLASTADPRDVQRCRESGIDVYLAKPIKQKDLLAAARHALGAPLPASSVPAPDTPRVPGRAPARGLRVLVAEDNPVNQRLALAILEHEGYAAVLAANGVEALRLFDAEPFDLILMDVQMPELGGFETTALIREREQRTGHHTPIVAVTAHAMDGDRERCLAAGMDAYISKPLRAGELTELLASMAPLFPPVARVGADPGDPGAVADTGERGDRGDLGTAVEPGDAGAVADAGDLAAAGGAGAPVVAGAAGAPGAPAEPTALPQPGGREDPVAPGALPAGLLAAVGGDGALALELAGLFLVDSPQALDELGQALFAGDAERVGRAAHRLKGAAAALAADEVTHAAAEVEALARTGDLNGAAAALAALQEAHGALCAVLSAARGPGA
jgi:two-component system sensor histidine kinase/response regulator